MLKKVVKFIFFVAVLGGGVLLFLYYQHFMMPNIDGDGELYIRPGATTEEVRTELEALGVLKNADAFTRLADIKNYRGRNIVAGKYLITDGMTNNELINHLRAGNGKTPVSITFNLERDLEQLSGALAKDLMVDSTTIYNWLTNESKVQELGFTKETIIAMFVPNTYFVDWDISVDQLMQRMKTEYDSFWNKERLDKLAGTNLSQQEVATLASIVYWETKIPADMRTIAGVYINRLRKGIALQADPTLIFALGDYSVKRVLNKDKELNSPYNTYKYAGLPPGPILIPPIACIDAVLDYGHHDFYYFVAKEDLSGETYFSRTYQEHLIYAARYQRALNRRRVFR